jgi:hypothetical protein
VGTIFSIDVVRGRMDDPTATDLLEFWERTVALTGDDARRRLPEVACVVRDGGGAIAGACSVFAMELPFVGGRRLWVLRTLLPGDAAEMLAPVIEATFAALDAEFADAPGDPLGLCVLLDASERACVPADAVWADPRMDYTGYLADGRQVRIGYFAGARVSAGQSHGSDCAVPEGYRLESFAEQDAVSGEDLVELWVGEGVLPRDEAERRVDEVIVVVIDPDGRPAGVSTAYLQRNEQLGADFWHGRVMVGSTHRGNAISVALALGLREHLEAAHVAGDHRAVGVLFEVENELLNSYYPQATWPSGYVFAGTDARGRHLRVWHFAGVPAPQGSA